MDKQNNGKASMRKRRMIIASVAAAAVVLAIVAGVVISSLVGIAREREREETYGPVLLESGEAEIRLSLYEFLLSRMKGELYNSGYPVHQSRFWSEPAADTGMTNEEYYNQSILDTCKAYLASLVLYDQLCDSGEIAELSQSVYDDIDELIELNINLGYVADGSEEKMNELLSAYGVNTRSWREAMVVIAKAEYVQEYLYGGEEATKIGDNLKKEFYEENYHRFKHILVADFYYKNVTDSHGNDVYFNSEGRIAYDTKNGVRRYDSTGQWYIKDEFGDEVYFESATSQKPLYDKKKGETRFVTDEDNVIQKFHYTEQQMEERLALAQEIAALPDGDYESFESKAALGTDYSGIWNEEYSGFYLSDIERMSYSDYMKEMLDKLKVMKVGQIDMVEADDGYHVFMKYELEDGAYAEDGNQKWFEKFNSTLVERLFLVKCESIYEDIILQEEVLSGARSILEIGINKDY